MSEQRLIPVDEAKVSPNQARLLMGVIDPHQPPIRKDWDDHLVYRLAATVERQAAQIKRLQAALRTASDLDTLMGRGYLTPEDMEVTDE